MILTECYKGTGAFYDKLRTPAETVRWVRERLSDMEMDILHETVRIDKGRLNIPVYISKYHPAAARLTGTYKQMGKGATAEQAEASAIMELVERFSLFDFINRSHLPLHRIVWEDSKVISLAHMLKAIHSSKDDPEAEKNLRTILDSLPLEWIEAVSPSERKRYKVPFSWFWPINEYNGSASGNSFEEAAVQAVSEVTERHVCSVVTYGKLVTPEIDPKSIRNETARELIDRFEKNGINLILKDFSLDTGVPTVAAVAWDPSTYPERSEIVYTAGTAPDPERAVIRALTEVAQLAGDFDTEGRYVESGLPKFTDFRDAAYVLDCSDSISIREMPDCGSENFLEELEKMSINVESCGMKVFVADISHPELKIPVVYAMIAGNHFRDRTVNLNLPFHCARIASECPDREAAAETLQTVEKLYPGRYETSFYMARLHEERGEFDDAIRHYRDAINRNPDSNDLASIHCHIGVCLRETGRLDEAVAELETARELNPGLKEIHNQLGYCAYCRGNYLKAIESFEAAIAIDPGSAIDYANIASNLRKLGMNREAVRFYDMALELDPSMEWAREHRMEVAKLLD